ncbi:MAG TPA: hypothetical protein PKL97_10220, partial [Candidatus Omnitrophota bacterium]|nr:hypothetical protein [Candidatus Omnitrophota bacterium]
GNRVIWVRSDGESYTYDSRGRILFRVSRDGMIYRYRYGSSGRLSEIRVRRKNGVTVYRFYKSGQLKGIYYPNGSKELFYANGLPKQIVYSDGTMQEFLYFDYGALKRIVTTDSFGRVITELYNSDGQLIRLEISDGSVQEFFYDSGGQVEKIEITDSSGSKSQQFYVGGQLVRVVYPDRTEEKYEEGRLMEIRKPDGSTISFVYEKGKLVKKITRDAKGEIVEEEELNERGEWIKKKISVEEKAVRGLIESAITKEEGSLALEQISDLLFQCEDEEISFGAWSDLHNVSEQEFEAFMEEISRVKAETFFMFYKGIMIVISTGSFHDIKASDALADLLNQIQQGYPEVVMVHTHTGYLNQDGPSSLDLENAGTGTEYVVATMKDQLISYRKNEDGTFLVDFEKNAAKALYELVSGRIGEMTEPEEGDFRKVAGRVVELANAESEKGTYRADESADEAEAFSLAEADLMSQFNVGADEITRIGITAKESGVFEVELEAQGWRFGYLADIAQDSARIFSLKDLSSDFEQIYEYDDAGSSYLIKEGETFQQLGYGDDGQPLTEDDVLIARQFVDADDHLILQEFDPESGRVTLIRDVTDNDEMGYLYDDV